MPIPKEVILKLAADPEFQALSEQEQDSIVERLGQDHYKEVPKSQNILQRIATSIIQNVPKAPLGVQANLNFPFLPQMPMDNPVMDDAMDAANEPLTKGNPFLKAAIPMAGNVLAGTAMGGGAVLKGAKGAVENAKNPSKVLGRKIGELQSASPDKRVDFLKIMMGAMDDPKAGKVIEKSGIMSKYGGNTMDEAGAVTENLSNLKLQQSQDLLNDLKDGLRQAVKEGTVKSSERGIAKMLGDSVKAQDSVFQGFKSARGGYGFGKNLSKAAKTVKKQAVRGAAYGAGGAAGWSALSPFFKD